MSDNTVFHHHRLGAQTMGAITLLDALATPTDTGDTLRFFFKSGTPPNLLGTNGDYDIVDSRSIGGGLMVTATATSAKNTTLPLRGQRLPAKYTTPEPELFAGCNVLLATRNGETADTIADWLAYHIEHHGANAALILDRSENDAAFAKALKKLKIPGLKRLVLLTSPVPLGAANTPAEAHPFCAPDAPGKDRMEIPAADPWHAPLGDLLVLELLKWRYFTAANAVASLDTYDIIAPLDGTTIFQAAANSENGVVSLLGHRIYPWRLRKNNPAKFGDHICRQFDATKVNRRWCIDITRTGTKPIWRLARIVGAEPGPTDNAIFYRCMALRHPTDAISAIVPKTSLVEDESLLKLSTEIFGHKPVHIPEQGLAKDPTSNKSAIVTTMKNEGPFILEWVAYHRMIGVDELLVYTNDCDDGTDTMLDLLQEKGILQHRDNPFKETGLKPQHAALQAAESEPQIKNADWVTCIDVDEFITIHCGDGKLADLFAAVPDANMISMTWRLFGNADIHEYRDEFLTEKFNQCAPEFIRKPHQAWGFKTFFRHIGIFKKLGVHRPKGLRPQLYEQINWVNGSGKPLPQKMFRNGWRSTPETYGYDLVTLNHYAVRSAESFLVKRDRGRVNHVDRDQGLAYWFRMNNNAEHCTQVHRMLPELRAEFDRLMADPDIRAAHEYSVRRHREKIDALRATENYAKFYAELTGERMQRLSRMHANFGANVFLSGPEVVPDEVALADHDDDFFFTVEKGETVH